MGRRRSRSCLGKLGRIGKDAVSPHFAREETRSTSIVEQAIDNIERRMAYAVYNLIDRIAI
jgi:hypothetical protein